MSYTLDQHKDEAWIAQQELDADLLPQALHDQV